jgi:predicted transposase/invertase (TIGR01784 family)
MEKEEYEKSVLEYEDVQDAMEYHHRMGKAEGFNDGFEKGIEKGIERGIERGIEEGMVKGREEALLQTAQNLLALGISPSDVAQATGLTEEQIRQLQ